MRKDAWMVCLLAAAALTLEAQETFKPDHAKANINGLPGWMDVPAVRNARGEWEPVRLAGCRVYLAPKTALHEHLSFPCNEWFVTPAEGTYQLWLATEDAVSSPQTILMARDEPYRGFGSVAIHRMQPAGFVTVDVPVPADHIVKFLHLDAGGLGFFLQASSRNAGSRFAMPPGRVVAGIFNARDEAVAYSRPLSVKAGETTTFRVTPPDRGSDLLVVLRKPPGHRDGPPLDLVVSDTALRAPDVLLEQRTYVVAVWYALSGERVTFSAVSPTLELKREVELRPHTVSTLRADLTIKEERTK
jgi:hypothetical protein